MVPVPSARSEVFWDTNFLRASFTDSADFRGLSGDDGKKAFQKVLQGLDRSRVRLVQIEVAGYARYLAKWPDGTPKMHPLTWAYDHPDDPFIPSGIRAFTTVQEVDRKRQSNPPVHAPPLVMQWEGGRTSTGGRSSATPESRGRRAVGGRIRSQRAEPG